MCLKYRCTEDDIKGMIDPPAPKYRSLLSTKITCFFSVSFADFIVTEAGELHKQVCGTDPQ